MTYLAISLALTCLYLIWQLQRAQSATERLLTAHREERLDLVEQIERAHKSRSHELQTLAQRIQAPEIAVAQHQAGEVSDEPLYLPQGGTPYEDKQWDDQVVERLRERNIELTDG